MLKSMYHQAMDSPKRFKHKAILAIPSESYDSPVILVCQGLQALGWTIYTIRRPNINTWFCNTIIRDPRDVKFDFVLSSLHWGTRWTNYDRFDLHGHLKVLIDGDDIPRTWKEKYAYYCGKYKRCPEGGVFEPPFPYRWMDPLGNYEPDVLFTMNKKPGTDDIYIPSGIHREYLDFQEHKPLSQRNIDFAHIPGPGKRRKQMETFLQKTELPGMVLNEKVYGDGVIPPEIADMINRDRNIHSYYRWVEQGAYYEVLNRTKVLIYPGIYEHHHWESKRPYEAWISGCLVLMAKPTHDPSQYPPTELCPWAVYSSKEEMVDKAKALYENQTRLDRLRIGAVEGALKYFMPKPIARYFLYRIAQNVYH